MFGCKGLIISKSERIKINTIFMLKGCNQHLIRYINLYLILGKLFIYLKLTLVFFLFQNHLLPGHLEEDSNSVPTRTFDFHKFAEKFNSQLSCQTLNSGSNDLKEDPVLSNQSDRLSNSDDSNSENEDEIFLVFRGKPNNRQSTFDEGQAAAGKETDMIE